MVGPRPCLIVMSIAIAAPLQAIGVLALGTRMSIGIDPHQAGNIVVRIDLRRSERSVPHKFLNLAQVGSVVQELGCEGVPQNVRRRFTCHSTLPQKACHTALDIATRDTRSLL